MNALFEDLPNTILDWIVQAGAMRRLDKNELLFNEGERINAIFIVVDGLLGIYLPSADNTRLGVHGPGAVVGEMSFVEQRPTSATVIADETSTILELPYEKLIAKMSSDPEIAVAFYRALAVSLSQKLRHATERMAAASGTHIFDNELIRSATSKVTTFKEMLYAADREGQKTGAISATTYTAIATTFSKLTELSHLTLGPDSSLGSREQEQLSARLRHELLPFVLMTDTAERFYSKPRGYAGDFRSIERMYVNQPGGKGRLGPLIDRLFLESPAARALQNRRGIMAEEITDTVRAITSGPIRIMSLACGPARELCDVFTQSNLDTGRVTATLLDLDLQALAFVSEWRDKLQLQNQIHFLNDNLLFLALGRNRTEIEPQHLVYSIGLIDYLEDNLVIKLLNYIYSILAPGGRVVLGNFHPRNNFKQLMDHVLEWRLVHRSEADMNRLFECSTFGKICSRTRLDTGGINLFAECVKT